MPDPASGIAYTVFAVSLILALLLSGRGVAGRIAILIAASAPPLFLLYLCHDASDRMGDLRLELRRIHFSASAAVSVGSSPETDDVVIAQRSYDLVSPGAAFASLQWAGCEPVGGPCLRQGIVSRANSLIRITDPGGTRRWLGAKPFADHVLCDGTARIGYNQSLNRLTVNGTPSGPALPLAAGRVFQLRNFAGAGGDNLALVDSQNVVQVVPVGTTANAIAVSARCSDARRGDAVTTLMSGTKLAVFLVDRPLAVDVAASKAEHPDDPGKWVRASLVERRSLTINAASAAGIDLSLDTPDIFRVPHNREARRRYRDEGGHQISFGNLGALLLGTTIEAKRFPSTGKPVADKLFQLVDLCMGDDPCEPQVRGAESAADKPPPALQSSRLGVAVDAVRTRLAGQFADREEIFGARDGNHILVRLQTLDWSYFPFFFAFWGGLAALVFSPLITAPARAASPALLAILLMVDLLLLMRLIIGFEAALVSPNQRNILALIATPMAMFAVPSLAAAVARVAVFRATRSIWFWLGSLLALAACLGLAHVAWNWIGGGSFGEYRPLFWLTIGISSAAFILPFAGPMIAASGHGVLSRLDAASGWPVHLSVVVLSAVVIFVWSWEFTGRPWGLVYLVLLLNIGFALSISVRAAVAAQPTSWRAAAMLFWPWATAVVLILAAAAFDQGFGLVTLCSLLLVFVGFGYWFSVAGKALEPAWRGSFAVAAWMVLLVSCAYAVALVLAPSQAAPTTAAQGGSATQQAELATADPQASDADLKEMLESAVHSKRSIDRWLAFASPSTLRQKGTLVTESARAEFFQMSEYANQGPWGRGWLNQPQLKGMAATQSADFAPAVHVMAPFGRIGLVAFLLALLGAVWRYQRHLGNSAIDRTATLPLAALCGLWLMLGGTLYVALANIMLVPFTGRNIILACPFSMGDLLDGLALTAVAYGCALWAVIADRTATAEETADVA